MTERDPIVNSDVMGFTGERYIPEIHGNIELEHLHRYLFASTVVKEMTVLDIASGEGYGSAMLSRTAQKVIGVDISIEAISHAQAKYRIDNLKFLLGSCLSIPIKDASVDIVVSFETIEHLSDHDKMMREIKRVLRPGGVVIISSPDKLEYSEKPNYSNPYHVKELYREDFCKFLNLYFKNHSMYGQRVIYGSALFCEDNNRPVKSYELNDPTLSACPGVPYAVYLVAVASDAELPSLPSGILEQPINDSDTMRMIAADYETQINTLNGIITNLESQNSTLNQIVIERDNLIANIINHERELTEQLTCLNQPLLELPPQISALGQALGERDNHIAEINNHVRELTEQLTSLNRTVLKQGKQISVLDQAIIERDKHISEINSHARELTEQLTHLNQIVSERDKQIDYLEQTVVVRDEQILDSKQEISNLLRSTSWLITKPLRYISRLVSVNNFTSVESRQLTMPDKHDGHNLAQDTAVLPIDFVGDVYLNLNPDLLEAGVDAQAHYLNYGQYEGRIYSLPKIDISSENDLNVDHETILMVSHEASRTGAPILSLNLVQSLIERYNVVVLLLGEGELAKIFRLTGAAVIISPELRCNPTIAYLVVDQLCDRFNFKFALINSIESRVVLSALSDRFVPSISLLHEFASYTRPRHAFRDALFLSSEVVFSAKLTYENALSEYPDLDDYSAYILPQGRCLLPLGEFTDEQFQAEKLRISKFVRPEDIGTDSIVVLGAGFVHLRKGVDLFIECASRVIRTPGGKRCRFVWIGKGYDPDSDIGYSVYIADQIRRAGLQKYVFFVNETFAIEAAYEEADLLLLSSRLDPLPNVAIDALTHGVPVLCFNKTTGIADFLIQSGLKDYCVADYLDSSEMADKIKALLFSKELRVSISEKCRAASIAYFDMYKYVHRLEQLALDAYPRMQQEAFDTQTILESGLFRQDFSCPPHRKGLHLKKLVRAYVREWASGIGRRKPFPGFHPGIYLERHGLAIKGADPFADYLRAGQPEGQWHYPVIVAGAGEPVKKELPANHRIALHLHVYYPDMLSEITKRLSLNRICPDLFVSITNEKHRESIITDLKNYTGKIVDIQIVPNRGRDIGPLFTAFGQRILDQYDIVGHFHTKKSADVKDTMMGKSWNRFLLENLIGGDSGAMADSVLTTMHADTTIGIVFADDPYVIGWSANRNFAEPLAARAGLQELPEHFLFPIGTMFWARTSALAPLINLCFDWGDYPEEPLPYDGTILHAIERMITLIAGGEHCVATNVVGLTR